MQRIPLSPILCLLVLTASAYADQDADKIYEAEDYLLAPDILEPDINSTD